MRTSNPDRLTAATSEQLLDGGPGPAGLGRLLAAAAGPGTARELAGETAAVAAFVDAPRASPLPGAPVRRPSMLSTALSKILAAKVLAAVVLLAGAGGGVALAANASQSSSPTDETPVTSAEAAEPDPNGDAAAGPDAAGPSPEPSVAGLCDAWAAGATDNPGKAADNPAFRSLVEAAGSEDDVPDFCADRERTDRPGGADDGRASHDEDEDTDDVAEPEGNGSPPTTAPGNPDHPAGPPADRANRDGDGAGRDSEDARSTGAPGSKGNSGSKGTDAKDTGANDTDTDTKDTGVKETDAADTDSEDTDRDDDGRSSAEQGRRHGGGESAGHRQKED